jgi:hypothetical protein
MQNRKEVFLYSDQPTTCPACGSRTEIILDLSHIADKTTLHQCLDGSWSLEFFVEDDTEASEAAH